VTKRIRTFTRCALAIVLASVGTCLSPPIAAQSPANPWTHPRTPWGDPDLTGLWPITHLNGTPVQRPVEFGERRLLTDKEFAEREARLAQLHAASIGNWAEIGQPNRLTSLVVEPSNGRLPPLTEDGRRRSATMTSSWSDILFDGFESFNALDRCMTRGLPASMFPFMYNSGIEIMQAPGYVVIRLELIHETRVIPVDGRPPLSPAIRPWLGEPRGRWEGNTLVVDTTNFNGRTPMLIVGPGGNPIPTSQSMRIRERLTRVDADTIEYEIRVDDPVVLTQPWTAALPWKRDPSYHIYEYACHEGNRLVRDALAISRYREAR
jgi:hypothetical protein